MTDFPNALSVLPDVQDPERLAELVAFDILDTPSEEGFDDVVQIARTICQAPVALVSFVAAERQWFKARAGFSACETDLKSSVCAFALSEPDLLVIPDLSLDPRTRSNPLVAADPHIRFYAGAPLRSETGRAMGSLCVIDGCPRPGGLNEEQADALRRLARQVMILMRERLQLAKLRTSEAHARSAATRRLALIELGDHLRDASTAAEMTARTAEIVGRTLGGNRAGYGELDPPGQFITLSEEWRDLGISSALGRHRLSDFEEIRLLIARGENVVVNSVKDDPRTATYAAGYAAFGIVAFLNVPVRDRGRTVGMLYVHTSVERNWRPEELIFARNVADRLQIGIARLRAEDEQAILNNELSHRMKNVMAMVQAIARQTLRNSSDLGTAQESLSARLAAMGKSHDLLLTGIKEGASLEAIIRGALAIHDDKQTGRLRVSGPFVQVGSGSALSLALVIHELATNAGKYGALSLPEGYISVAWEITGTRNSNISLRWVEHDGPLVVVPKRKGLGTRLIERGLTGIIGSEVGLSFPPSGVIFTVTAPIDGIAADK